MDDSQIHGTIERLDDEFTLAVRHQHVEARVAPERNRGADGNQEEKPGNEARHPPTVRR